MAAGISQKRIYINRPQLNFNYSDCVFTLNLFETTNPWELTYPLYAMIMNSGDYAFADISCFDCRMKGGTMTKPEFWEE